MEIRNVIELSAFSKSLSKKITYLNHEERILIDIEQIAAITPSSEREDLPKKVGLASLFKMRSKRKMETVRIRKANATIKKEKVVCFAQDRDVSTRILAILSVGQTKSGVKKETKGADGNDT